MIEHIDDILASDLLERYVLGDVSPEERIKVESLRLEHHKIREELDNLESTIEKFSKDNAIKAPKEARECIIKSISGNATDKIAPSQTVTSSLWRKVTASMLIGGMVMWMWMQDSLKNANRIIEAQASELEILQRECEQVTQHYAFLNDHSTVPVLLEGSSLAPESQVIVYWNETFEKSMLKVVELPSIKEDQTFQLWADVEGEMLSLGTFDAGLAIVDPISVNFLANATSLNITIEPVGGSDHPTLSTLTASKTI